MPARRASEAALAAVLPQSNAPLPDLHCPSCGERYGLTRRQPFELACADKHELCQDCLDGLEQTLRHVRVRTSVVKASKPMAPPLVRIRLFATTGRLCVVCRCGEMLDAASEFVRPSQHLMEALEEVQRRQQWKRDQEALQRQREAIAEAVYSAGSTQGKARGVRASCHGSIDRSLGRTTRRLWWPHGKPNELPVAGKWR